MHNLFASSAASTSIRNGGDHKPSLDAACGGPDSSYAMSRLHETRRANDAVLSSLHNALALPLQSSFRSNAALATELIPYTLRMLSPDVKPTLVGNVASVRRGSEKERVNRAVDAMCAIGIKFEKGKVEMSSGEDDEGDSRTSFVSGNAAVRANAGWVYRMEPPLDEIGTYTYAAIAGGGDAGKARYAVRQVLEQEWRKETARKESEARLKRVNGFPQHAQLDDGIDKRLSTGKIYGKADASAAASTLAQKPKAVKKDFFGRPIEVTEELSMGSFGCGQESGMEDQAGQRTVVKKGITMKEHLEA